jgi:hypothetical protein
MASQPGAARFGVHYSELLTLYFREDFRFILRNRRIFRVPVGQGRRAAPKHYRPAAHLIARKDR